MRKLADEFPWERADRQIAEAFERRDWDTLIKALRRKICVPCYTYSEIHLMPHRHDDD